MIAFEIEIKPITVNKAFHSYPVGKFCTFVKSKEYVQFEKDLAKLLPKHEMIKGEISVMIVFYIKRYSNTDVDNLTKPFLDCLAKAKYFENDNKITNLHISKQKSDTHKIQVLITSNE